MIFRGEIIRVDFPAEGIKGEFAVWVNRLQHGAADIVIGQYEKGIEGLLADLQSSTVSMVDEDRPRPMNKLTLPWTSLSVWYRHTVL